MFNMKRIGFGPLVLAIISVCLVLVGASGENQISSELDITWVSINELGFKGQMSKYETTNAQYAKYLNSTLASGDIVIEGQRVYGTTGPYAELHYYQLDGPAFNYIHAVDGGKSRISFDGSTFTVNKGFENHPVTFVSWSGATAFASYYGWRLPTEWEWQAVADYDGSYTYGCGTKINKDMANYELSINPHGTIEVGVCGTYGYGMADMAGNVAEWTSNLWDPEYKHRVYRGGGWYCGANVCEVSDRCNIIPEAMWPNIGFRVCR
jgi:formylglycine-generating enzyme required for sulfatase activity